MVELGQRLIRRRSTRQVADIFVERRGGRSAVSTVAVGEEEPPEQALKPELRVFRPLVDEHEEGDECVVRWDELVGLWSILGGPPEAVSRCGFVAFSLSAFLVAFAVPELGGYFFESRSAGSDSRHRADVDTRFEVPTGSLCGL